MKIRILLTADAFREWLERFQVFGLDAVHPDWRTISGKRGSRIENVLVSTEHFKVVSPSLHWMYDFSPDEREAMPHTLFVLRPAVKP